MPILCPWAGSIAGGWGLGSGVDSGSLAGIPVPPVFCWVTLANYLIICSLSVLICHTGMIIVASSSRSCYTQQALNKR